MASQKNAYDEMGEDLASMTLIPTMENDADMVPLHVPEYQVQDDSDTASSDSSNSPTRKHSRSRAKKIRKASHQTQQSKPLLRPANDILSRIRHDPALDQSKFIIGYLDRHSPNVMEIDVSLWKGGGDVTDEDWIPQHRIMYFRKKTEEAERKVWDRAARLDRLFGSGVVADEHMSEGNNARRDDQVADTQKAGSTYRETDNVSSGATVSAEEQVRP